MDIKFNSIHNEESDHLLKKFFHSKTPIGVSDSDFILINDRKIEIVIKAKTIIWFDFSQICGTARSIDDYIAIAREYQSVIISKVPILDDEKENGLIVDFGNVYQQLKEAYSFYGEAYKGEPELKTSRHLQSICLQFLLPRARLNSSTGP